MSATLRNQTPPPNIPPVRIARENRQILFRIGRDLKRSANNEILHGTKTGRIYVRRIRGGRKRRHRSSAPGETHANLTGALRKSIGWQVQGHQRLFFGYGITREAPIYARSIERGNPDLHIEARPSIRNAVNAERRNIMQHMRAGMNLVLQP